MTDRVRLAVAVALVALGLIGVLLGSGAYLQAWRIAQDHAASGEAERAERQLADLSTQPEWVDDGTAPPTSLPVVGALTSADDSADAHALDNTDPGKLTDSTDDEASGPRASPAEIELVGVEFRFFDPPEAGAHARVAVELRSRSSLPSDPIRLLIPNRWFEDYRIIGAVPAVLEDRLGPDGYRYFEFPGLAPETSTTLEVHLASAGDSVNPPEVRVSLASGDEIGQDRPKTVAPRPRPGPANAVSIPRLGVQARVIPTAWEPVAFLVGQIRDSANLSEGNSVLIGHLGGPAGNVFAPLNRARPRDEVIATSRGLDYRFVVSEINVLPNTDTSPLQKSDTARVTLMTCTGTYNPLTQDYSHRLWVIAEPPELAEKTIAANAARAAAAAAEAERAAQVASETLAQAGAGEASARPPGPEPQESAAGRSPASGAPAPAVRQPLPEPQPEAAPTSAATRPAAPRSANVGLAILAPANETRVPRRFVVKGVRGTPIDASMHVWMLVRAEVDGARWYLYPREIVPRSDGAWEAELDLGGPPNVRHELRVGAVDARAHTALARRAVERPGEPLDNVPRGFSDEASIVVIRG